MKQFLDDTRHEPISQISASTRELRRILSLFERSKSKDVQCASPRILSPFFVYRSEGWKEGLPPFESVMATVGRMVFLTFDVCTWEQ